VRVIISPEAGARALAFENLESQSVHDSSRVTDRSRPNSVFSSVGALRDDVAIEPPPSTSDKIAKYTHDFPAGMFNRPYRYTVLSSGSSAVVRFTYDAPDVVPHGAHFERVVSLMPDARYFTVDESVRFPHAAPGTPQRAVSVTSLYPGEPPSLFVPLPQAYVVGGSVSVTNGSALGVACGGQLATVAWRRGDVENATIAEKTHAPVVRLTLTPGRTAHMLFAYSNVNGPADVPAEIARLEALAQGPPPTPANSPH
jgi:hypothetical protein